MDPQAQANADVVKSTITTGVGVVQMENNPKLNSTEKEVAVQHMTSNAYISKAVPKVIKFSSRASIKITNNGQDHYYTVEYGEERQIDDFNEVDIDKERQFLIDDCNNQVDNQVKEIVETFLR